MAQGRQLIESYGGGGFKVAGVRHTGSVLVFPQETLAWPVVAAADVTPSSLEDVVKRAATVRILLLGCGRLCAPRPPGLDAGLRAAGVVLEWMDTGAACRTFNVLSLEEREVAAALIAVD